MALAFCSLITSCSPRVHEKFEIHHGINLSNAFHVTVGNTGCTFHPEDIDSIAAAGFDFVRIPIDEQVFFTESREPVREHFWILREAIEKCMSKGLRVVVDLHVLRSHTFLKDTGNALFTDPAAQQRFSDIWRLICAYVGDYPTSMVAYEILNEAVADTDEEWNVVLNLGIKAIRGLEPERTIIISPNKWQDPARIKNMDIPKDDQNLILSFHFYAPMMLSHCGASWNGYRDVTWPVHYPGQLVTDEDIDKHSGEMSDYFKNEASQSYDYERLEKMILAGVEGAQEKGLPLYLGEFGIISNANVEDAARWYKDVVSICEKYGIAYSAWAYSGKGFGTFDIPDRKEKLLPILTGRN